MNRGISGILLGMETTDAEFHHATLAPPQTERLPLRAVTLAPARAGWFGHALASPLALVPIVVLALALRLYGLNWDAGQHLHPDERWITVVTTTRVMPQWPPVWSTLLDPDHSPLNTRTDYLTGEPKDDFSYGSLPLFVTKAVAGIMTALTHVPWTDYDHAVYVGRALSALLDIGTLLIVYALARRYAAWAGTVAAFLLAVCVEHIQLAHFFATDTWVTFFATATLWAAVRAAERGRGRDFAIAGALAGCAVACKASVAFLAVPLLAAIVMDVVRWHRRDARSLTPLAIWGRGIGAGINVFWGALVAFAVAEPYVLPRLHTYLASIGTQASMVKGDLDYPYTRQYVGTGLTFHLKNLVLWGMGPALGIFAMLGAVWALARVVRTHRAVDVVLLAWVIPYAAYTAPQAVKFMRYWQPLYPALIVLGVAMIADLTRARARPPDRRRWVQWMKTGAVGATVLVALCTTLWAAAFESIYTQTHTRVAGSQWMIANVAAGSVVSTEIWDDALPLRLSPGQPEYSPVRPDPAHPTATGLDLYPDEGTGEQRLAYLARAMGQANYIVISSDTVRASIPHLPWRYPVTIRWYDLLESGQLGYTRVYDGQDAPHLGPWQINDSAADQSFSYYDHPHVRVYQRTRTLTLDQLRPLFANVLTVEAAPSRTPPKSPMLTQAVETLPVVADRGWGGAFTHHGPVAVVLYLLLFELFGLIGWPVAARIFRRFPDRGWGMAKALGWLGCGYLVWLGASTTTAVSFALPWCVLAVVVASAVSALIAWRTRATLRAHLRTSLDTMLTGEGIALAGFTLFLLFRLRNPDLWQTYWGGEKVFELAHLNAILRSAQMPPYDPWFAGGVINYYYFGGYLEAFAMKLTGVPTEVAFNVALPMTMALVWGAAYSVGAAIWVAVRRHPERETDAAIGGALATLGVGFLGNLDGAAQVVRLLRAGTPLRMIPRQFDFWESTRLIQIDEFPFFSGLYADLHAHLIALPFALIVVGLALTLALHWDATDRNISARTLLRGAPWAAVAVAVVVVGALYPMNAWDFPTALVLLLAGAATGLRFASGRWGVALIGGGGVTALVALLGRALYAPFYAHFVTLYSAIERVDDPSPLVLFLAIFGLALAIIALGLGVASPARGWMHVWVNDEHGIIIGAAVIGLAIIAWVTKHPVLVLTLPFLGFLVLAWLRADRTPGRRMLYAVGAVALGVLSAVDVVYLADRMNTVFKFYFQAWTLLALTAVGFVALVVERWRHVSFALRSAFLVVAAVGMVCSLMYPVFGTPARLQYRMPPSPATAGLNGNAWMETGTVPANQFSNSGAGEPVSFAGDYALINWLNANIKGTPVVAEAAIGPYRGNGSRISSATGLPTIIGWDGHESQQRDDPTLSRRVADTRTLYTSASPAPIAAVIARYHVRYIVVGEVERLTQQQPGQMYSTPEGLQTLATMADAGALRIAWQDDRTILYEVMGGATR